MFGWAFGALLMALATLPSPRVPSEAELDIKADASWCAVLEFAHQHGLQFGTDIVFTYGPLGYLATPYTFSAAPGPRLVTDISLSFLSALSVCLLARRLGKLPGTALVCVYLFLAGNILPRTDLLLELNLCCWGILCMVESGQTWMMSALILSGIAVFAGLVKVTLLTMAVLTVGGVSLDLFLRGRRGLSLALPAALVFAFIAVWIGTGQNLSHLATFLHRAFITSVGYNNAMGYEGSVVLREYAIVTLLLAVATIVSAAIAGLIKRSVAPQQLEAASVQATTSSPRTRADRASSPLPLASRGGEGNNAAPLASSQQTLERAEGLAITRKLVLTAWLLGVLFLVWKHGFVRADRYHAGFFFGFAPVVALVCGGLALRNSHWLKNGTPPGDEAAAVDHTDLRGASRLPARKERLRWWPLVLAVGCVLLSLFTAQTLLLPGDWPTSAAQPFANVGIALSDLARPAAARERIHAAIDAERRRSQLAAFRGVIGQSSVDLFGWEQIDLLATDLKYRPRPVFQSYAAYSTPLMEWNETFYQAAAAPEFVVFRLSPMDHKLPTMEDAFLLRHLLINYDLVGREEPFLLLRTARREQAQLRLLTETTIRQGEPLDLARFGATNLWLEMDLKPTLLGRLRQVLYQPAKSRLVVSTTESGKQVVRRFRAPPSMLAAGFIISPLEVNTDDVLALYQGVDPNRPKTCGIEINAGDEKFWQAAIRVRIYALENQLARHVGVSIDGVNSPGTRPPPP